jgi:hypothetical protein
MGLYTVLINPNTYEVEDIFLRGERKECFIVTLSGIITEDVEAPDEVAASHFALQNVLKKRITSLESSLKRESEARKNLIDQKNDLLIGSGKREKDFMDIISDGEINLYSTGRRIVGKWYKRVGEDVEFELEGNWVTCTNAFEQVIRGFMEAQPKEDCYE